ncbi:MAG: DUF3108 domain-containing protein [Gammaproteobacteria bacterium]|nr:DUF3108 domain-containing protein [Gammaproteobacteria bacterium]MBU1623958.1 DUF3108 domain-containing protein [Gammaproteobacteria bacterium]MBU1982175.1 DUF3108 domain-containing protein [Gammaproteobacteria bacterium]
MRTLFVLFLACLSFNLRAETLPQRIEASYDILKHDIKLAEVNEIFERHEGHYRITSVTKPVGLLALFQPETIVVSSEGEITQHGLLPLHFKHSRTRNHEKNSSADFDWENNELTLSSQSGIKLLTLHPFTQDRLSIMYQFAAQPPHGRLEFKFDMTNGHKVNEYHYQLNPAQTVQVPFGNLRSYYLYTPPQKTKWKSELWLAIDHSFVPCKVVVTEDDGAQLVQVLRKLNIEQ